jgi:hypothetical protein
VIARSRWGGSLQKTVSGVSRASMVARGELTLRHLCELIFEVKRELISEVKRELMFEVKRSCGKQEVEGAEVLKPCTREFEILG